MSRAPQHPVARCSACGRRIEPGAYRVYLPGSGPEIFDSVECADWLLSLDRSEREQRRRGAAPRLDGARAIAPGGVTV